MSDAPIGEYVHVPYSDARAQLAAENGVTNANQYGIFLWREAGKPDTPVICGCGGSMYLCVYHAMKLDARDVGMGSSAQDG